MDPHILNTPQSIYETVTTHFPEACVKVQVQKTEAIAIKIFLDFDLPAIHLYGAVCKSVLELRLQKIKVFQALNKPLLSSDLDCSQLSMERPLIEWLSFSRTAYEREGGCYVNLIADYLNDPTQEAEQKLLDLGLAPDQVCRDGYLLSDGDLSYFRHLLDKDLRFNVKMQAKYPGIFEQIQDQAIEEDLRNRPPSHYDKILKILQTRVLGQEMATAVVASALSSQQSGRDENHNFLFVGPTGTGKTELAKTIATTKKAFVSFKMNQYPHEHDSTRFFGSPAGYLGSDSKPDLAKELDRCQPTQSGLSNGKKIFTVKNIVILFDELEKAHVNTQQSLLTLFDEGIIDISYTERGLHGAAGTNLKIQYQLKKSIIIGTSNLFQKEIHRTFQQNKNSEEIAEEFIRLNGTNFSPKNYSPEFLARLTITPFGPIPRGGAYQNILKMKMDIFLKEFKTEMKCHLIVIKEGEEDLFYQGLEDLLYGNGSDLRKVAKFFDKIKRIINQNRDQCGDISNKKFTLYCDNRRILLKLAMFSYGTYREVTMPPILIQA